jgi:hypothetical protein
VLVAGEDEVHAGALEALDRVARVVDDVPLTPRTGDGQQMVVADEDPQVGGSFEALLDPGVAAAADLAVVEIGLGRVDRHHSDAADARHGIAVAEELLEMDVADVARVVVAGDDDDGLAVEPVEVVLCQRVLLLETEGRQVARTDDDLRFEVIHLGDRALEQVRQEELRPAMHVRDLDDREGAVARRSHERSLGGTGPSAAAATLIPGDARNA